jgi:hypothetical protein
MEKTVYRTCSYCFFEALSFEDLENFVKDKRKEKFYFTKNICKKCNAKKVREEKQGKFHGPFFIRICIDCRTLAQNDKDLKNRFVKDKTLKSGYANRCKKCNSIRVIRHSKLNPELFKNRILKNRLKTAYGIDIKDYDNMRAKQGYKCAICFKSEEEIGKKLHIDHDHGCCFSSSTCGKCIRGLLCYSCNIGLGNFKDSPKILKNAIIYLGG